MKSGTIKLLTVLLSLLVVAIVGSQLYYRINEKHKTVEAEIYSYNDNIPVQGVIVRDEKVITYNGDGVLDYQYSDGSKVSVDSVLANVYSSADDILANQKIDKLNTRIEELQRAQQPGTTDYIQPETIKSQIDNQYKEIISASLNNDFDTISKTEENMTVLMSIYNIVTKSTSDYNDSITALQSQVADLKSTASDPKESIKADRTGYFVCYADGYEETLTTNGISSMTSDDIQAIIDGTDGVAKPKNAVGKMFDDYTCNIVAVVDNDSRLVEGKTLQAEFSSAKDMYDVVVESVTPIENTDQSMLVLSCDRLDETLVSERVLRLEIVFEEYTGIKVPREAIRFDGDVKGVYVILGQNITFKKIDIIYEGDDYVLSKNTSDEDYLLLYDQILLEVVSSDYVASSTESS